MTDGGVDQADSGSQEEADPHVPRPREHELPNGDLAVATKVDRWVFDTEALTVPAEDRPLYRLLMEVLEDVHVPDLMPADMAVLCDSLVEVRDHVSNVHRGSIGGTRARYGMSFAHNVRRAIDDFRDDEPKTLVAVGCSGSKTDDPGHIPAADRYTGTYWQKKREYYEAIADDGRIISAEFGVLHPDEPIPTYERVPEDLEGIPVDSNQRLPNGDPVDTLLDQWAIEVFEGLQAWVSAASSGLNPADINLEFLLGRRYIDPLEARGVFAGLDAAGEISISFPWQEAELGGIGEQMGWVKDQLAAVEDDADTGEGVATDGGVDVVTTAIGGRNMSSAVQEGGALLGFETGQSRPPDYYDIEFCDFPFTSESATFADHLEVVKRERPTIAVAPDIEHGRDPKTVYEQADQLAEFADTVVVVPKSIPPAAVPDRFRVGVPLASYGDELPWTWDAYEAAESLHLLGGSPTVQLEFGRYFDTVRSVDGASALLAAQHGDVWAPTKPRNWHPTGGDQMGYYERVAASVANIVEAWRVHRTDESGDFEIPIEPDDYERYCVPEVERVEMRNAYHDAGTRGARPTIHPDDADCLRVSDLEGFTLVDWDEEREQAEQRGLKQMRQGMEQAGLAAFGAPGQRTNA